MRDDPDPVGGSDGADLHELGQSAAKQCVPIGREGRSVFPLVERVGVSFQWLTGQKMFFW